jgi:hypothetical protein
LLPPQRGPSCGRPPGGLFHPRRSAAGAGLVAARIGAPLAGTVGGRPRPQVTRVLAERASSAAPVYSSLSRQGCGRGCGRDCGPIGVGAGRRGRRFRGRDRSTGAETSRGQVSEPLCGRAGSSGRARGSTAAPFSEPASDEGHAEHEPAREQRTDDQGRVQMPRPHNVAHPRLYDDITVLQREQDTAAEGADQQQHSEDKHLNASDRSPRKVAYPAGQDEKRRRRDRPGGLPVPRRVDQHAGVSTERP